MPKSVMKRERKSGYIRKRGDFASFWLRVQQQGDCWIWMGSKNGRGYGHVRRRQGNIRVHRLSYRMWVGPIPSWLEIDHLCQTRLCVNPAHLELVTHAENIRRRYQRQPAKTHCKRGHPFSSENTYIYVRPAPRGKVRFCRACHNIHTKAWVQRRKEQAVA